MTTEHISRAPDGGINEDLIAVFESRGVTDLIVLDGATSVADADYVDRRQGDVAWFVQAFAAELGRAIDTGFAQGAAVRMAVDAVRRAYRSITGDTAVPLYAHPLAALTWIWVRPMADHLALSLYCLGDCKTFALDGAGRVQDLDPYVNPHEAVVQEAIAALGPDGASDPVTKRARLLPMLRARREAQHGSPTPDVLCLAPQGEFSAREYALRLPLDTAVLAMTDGFYRLVDPYGLYDIAALARRCRSDGLAPLMDELRAFERARADAALAVKNADDASALLWTRHHLEGTPT
jgi:hypothetical protein